MEIGRGLTGIPDPKNVQQTVVTGILGEDPRYIYLHIIDFHGIGKYIIHRCNGYKNHRNEIASFTVNFHIPGKSLLSGFQTIKIRWIFQPAMLIMEQ